MWPVSERRQCIGFMAEALLVFGFGSKDDADLQPAAQGYRPAGVLQQPGLGVEL